MNCVVCGRSDVGLYRVNEKGVKGIWACEKHLHPSRIDPEVKRIVNAIEKAPR